MALKTRYSPLQHFSWDNLFASFADLPAVQKALALGVIGLVVLLVLFLPFSFATRKVSSLRKDIASIQKGASQVMEKISAYQKAKANMESLEKQFGGSGGALTTRIENLAKQSGLTVDQVKDKAPMETDYLEISSLEVKISNVTLEQLLELLYNVENDKSSPMKIRRIQVKPRSNNRQVLDVSFEVATFAVRKDNA